MGNRKNRIANNWSVSSQTINPLDRAHKLGLTVSFGEPLNDNRKDFPESERNILIITSANGRDISGQWVHNSPKNVGEYYPKDRICVKEKEIVILIKIGLWNSQRHRTSVEKIVSEFLIDRGIKY